MLHIVCNGRRLLLRLGQVRRVFHNHVLIYADVDVVVDFHQYVSLLHLLYLAVNTAGGVDFLHPLERIAEIV